MRCECAAKTEWVWKSMRARQAAADNMGVGGRHTALMAVCCVTIRVCV